MPLPGTRVIHPQFAAHHKPTVEGTMKGRCHLQRPSAATGFDDETGQTITPPPVTLWTGPFRAQRTTLPQATVTVGDRTTYVQALLVGLPAGVPTPHVGDLIHIIDGDDDPDLSGVVLGVREVRSATILWERDLVCELQPPRTG